MKSAETSVISMISAKLRCFFTGCFFILLYSIGVFAEEEPAAFDSLTESPYDTHGKLSVVEAQLIDDSGQPFQIRGISSSTPEFLNSDVLSHLKLAWHANTVRLAVSSDSETGYASLDEAGRLAYQDILVNVVKEAYSLGLYVVIDWHTPENWEPSLNKDIALSFFQSLSLKLQGYDHVLYEICGNPKTTASWNQISLYAAEIIDVIRLNAPNSIIIVGTPNWEFGLEAVMLNPISRNNLLYSFQLYATAVGDEHREALFLAVQNKLPLIVSQFSFSDTPGISLLSYYESIKAWFRFFENQDISYLIHDFSNHDTPDALIESDIISLSVPGEERFTSGANWYLSQISNFDQPQYADADLSAVVFPVQYKLSNGTIAIVAETPNWYGDSASCEYLVWLENPSSIDMTNWRIRFTWNQDILLIPEFWNCDIGGSSSSRLVISKEYNAVVSPDSFVNFGFVVTGTTSPKLISVEIE